MEAHTQDLTPQTPPLRLQPREVSGRNRLAVVGTVSGVIGGLVMALPLVLYDWGKASYAALELSMAVTAWLFGLGYFRQNGYDAWAIVVGALFLLLYWQALGLAFAGLADRVYRVTSLAGSLALGAVWSFVSFMFFWYICCRSLATVPRSASSPAVLASSRRTGLDLRLRPARARDGCMLLAAAQCRSCPEVGAPEGSEADA